MPRIPTPIPPNWVAAWRDYWRQRLILRVWQLLLVVVGGLLVLAALSSGAVLVATLAGIVISVVLADDIRATIRNVWNLNFWTFKIET